MARVSSNQSLRRSSTWMSLCMVPLSKLPMRSTVSLNSFLSSAALQTTESGLYHGKVYSNSGYQRNWHRSEGMHIRTEGQKEGRGRDTEGHTRWKWGQLPTPAVWPGPRGSALRNTHTQDGSLSSLREVWHQNPCATPHQVASEESAGRKESLFSRSPHFLLFPFFMIVFH